MFRCIVLGAAGRDFHDVQTFFRDHPGFRVVAITAAQIPYIDQRNFPKALAGPAYEEDIPIVPESELGALIDRHRADWVFLSYSDLSHEDVMHKASIALAHGAGFAIAPPRETQLRSARPVVSITAVRTGAGKSPLTQWLAAHLRARGLRVGVLRHPMPYGDLRKQSVQRFASESDLDKHACTIEEREEYQPYLSEGFVIFAGVDYRAVLRAADAESDVILWDGGNNDLSFIRADLSLVVCDALRPGHEARFHPGEANFRGADVLIINKVDAARPDDVAAIAARASRDNPRAQVITAALDVRCDRPELVRGKRALVIEDGPTVTHGSMPHGAGYVAALREAASEIIDPRPFAVGSIREAFERYPHIGPVLPALGYSDAQRADLAATIAASGADVVLDASPSRVDDVITVTIPVARVSYTFAQRSGDDLAARVDAVIDAARAQR
jgi:predicted GTPase